MTDYTDLVRRLRTWATQEHDDAYPNHYAADLIEEAADAIARLSVNAEPVATMYQHRETGRTLFVGADEQDDRYLPSYDCVGPLYLHPAAPAPATWQELVEQRLLSWRQRFVNHSGDQLALDDFMDKHSLDDLIDFVCDQYAAPAPEPPLYTISRGSDGRATVTTTPAPDDAKDAARYRFIRDKPWASELAGVIQHHQNAKWDAAIDAAMKEKP